MRLINLFEYCTVSACCVCPLCFPAAMKLRSKGVNGRSQSEMSEKKQKKSIMKELRSPDIT